MSQSDADHRAAAAVVAHHTELAAELDRHAAALRDATVEPPGSAWQQRRQALLTWLRTELVPHAVAEETGLYPAAAAEPDGRLLVEGMLAEHRAIIALVAELEAAGTAADATAAARALTALFEVHLAKENNLILPLLLDAPLASLADLLDGMHDLLGAGTTAGGGCGGGCGCGGDSAAADAPVPLLSVDTRIDVRAG